VAEENRQDVKLTQIERNIVESALARSPFFTFASLRRYFPHLASMQEFMTAEGYLGGLAVTFQGTVYLLDENKAEKLRAVIGLLDQIETEARKVGAAGNRTAAECRESQHFRTVSVCFWASHSIVCNLSPPRGSNPCSGQQVKGRKKP
jgi:hypothetical protein